ncbi:MAG: phosphatase PAP2-related protein [bacterium]
MLQTIHTSLRRHVQLWSNRKFLISVLAHSLFLVVSIFFTYLASSYNDGYTSGYIVPDLLLDHIPIVDVSYLFFQGAFFFGISVVAVFLFIPESIPFALITSAFFFATRALFMTMTHLTAPFIAHYSFIEYEHHVPQVVFSLTSGNDLFFSGHAGFPFLLALIFWSFKPIRHYFLMCSILASIIVIVGHLHYSIDVFSAFFITYGIFEIAKRIFKKEYLFFKNNENV